MADLYTYDNIVVTPLLEESVNHLLSEKVKECISEKLLAELEDWRRFPKPVNENDDADVEDEQKKVMSFSLVRRIQEQLHITPRGDSVPYISDLLKGTEIVLPRYRPPPRNPELVARLERIKADLENKEYNKMIGNLDDNTSIVKDMRIDVAATHRQMWMVFNFLLTVIGSFVFGYFAAKYAGYDLIWCYTVGLIFGLAVFFADLYFILKNL